MSVFSILFLGSFSFAIPPATAGVQTQGCSDNAECDDGNACTEDICQFTLGCLNEPIDPNDGNACTEDSCDPATGVANDPVDPNDNNACTEDSCDPATGVANDLISCDDFNECTAESCDGVTGCANTPTPGVSCNGGTCDSVGICQIDPEIEKFYTHTNNNWELRCDEPNPEDPNECLVDLRPANVNQDDDVFADQLPQNADDQFVLNGKQNPRKTVVTPGQYIAVSEVPVPVEKTVWIEEDFSACLEIGHVNPNSVPGGVQVVLILENGDVVAIDGELASGIGGSIDLEDDRAFVHVEDVPAGSVLRVMVKFQPNDDPGMIGLQCTNFENLLDETGAIIDVASADLIIEPRP